MLRLHWPQRSQWLPPRLLVAALAVWALPACGPKRSESPHAAAAPVIGFAEAAGSPLFRHHAYPTAAHYFPETMGSGVAVLDYDGDGRLDLFFLNGVPLDRSSPGRPPELLRNVDGAHFRSVTSEAGLSQPFYGMGCAAADFDNDGDTDLYCTAVAGPARLYRNELHPTGRPTFLEVAAQAGVDNGGRWGTSAAWLDYDRDGWLDLFVCNYVRYRGPRDDLPCYSGPQVRTYCVPSSYAGESCRLYRNTGRGSFVDATRGAGLLNPAGKSLGLVVWDFNQDGWPDLCIANDTEPLFLYINDGHGHFKEKASEFGVSVDAAGAMRGSMGIDAAEAPEAGAYLAFSNFWGEGAAFYQCSGSTCSDLAAPSGLAPATRESLGFGIRLFDADNDGAPEMLIANGHIQENVQRFHSKARYAEPPMLFHLNSDVAVPAALTGTTAAPMVARGLATGDLDGDGRLDAVMTECNGPAHVWLNRTEPRLHWLGIRLVGTRGNRDAPGARVEVTAGGRKRVDYCRSGGSYLSESAHELHFGLGASTAADSIRVVWPDGREETRGRVPADRTVTLREGEAGSD